MKKTILSVAVASTVSGSVVAADFGKQVERLLNAQSYRYFGVVKPLTASETVSVPRAHGQTAGDLIKLAKGLTAEIVTRKAGGVSDMIAFWPNDTAPTHIVNCVEGGRAEIAPGKFNPSVQRIDLSTGAVETLLRGMSGCDGIRRTPWNTIVATEETDDGGFYEIIDPLNTTENTVADRALGTISGPTASNIVKRIAMPIIAWEGLDITQEGVVYAGDEERPGTGGPDADGGSIFKFVPSTPWNGLPVTDLGQSPLAVGSVYAYQASCQARTSGSFPQFGQGCEVGEGAWVKVNAIDARASANANGATGYYRPEDGHFDPTYAGPGAKFCWTNTGNEGAKNYGEVLCMVDTNPMGTGEKTVAATGLAYLADSDQTRGFGVAVVNRVVEGDSDFNSVDNLAFQPVTGNMYVIEDHNFGDIFACLPDGADRDIKTDGCVKILSVRDKSAEPTGFTFTGDGKTAYLFIQHSDDANCAAGDDCAAYDDYPTDDLVRITGFKLP